MEDEVRRRISEVTTKEMIDKIHIFIMEDHRVTLQDVAEVISMKKCANVT